MKALVFFTGDSRMQRGERIRRVIARFTALLCLPVFVMAGSPPIAEPLWSLKPFAVQGLPVVIVEEGKLQEDRMTRERVDRDDVLHAARQRQGLRSLADVDYAVLETSGDITVVPVRRI